MPGPHGSECGLDLWAQRSHGRCRGKRQRDQTTEMAVTAAQGGGEEAGSESELRPEYTIERNRRDDGGLKGCWWESVTSPHALLVAPGPHPDALST